MCRVINTCLYAVAMFVHVFIFHHSNNDYVSLTMHVRYLTSSLLMNGGTNSHSQPKFDLGYNKGFYFSLLTSLKSYSQKIKRWERNLYYHSQYQSNVCLHFLTNDKWNLTNIWSKSKIIITPTEICQPVSRPPVISMLNKISFRTLCVTLYLNISR